MRATAELAAGEGGAVRRWLSVAALLLLASAYAWPMQGGGGTPNAQYALVKAIEDGTPRVEQSLRELGDFPTRDLVRIDGGLYSNKAPGLAFVTVPLYAALESAGVDVVGDPTRGHWALGLVGVVLPGGAAPLRHAHGRRLVSSPATAPCLRSRPARGTLSCPTRRSSSRTSSRRRSCSSAFALLWRDRRAGGGTAARVSARVPSRATPSSSSIRNALAGGGARPLRARRHYRASVAGATYAAGFVVGVAAPGLLYNWWAFGSPFFNAYGTSPEGQPTNLWGSPSVRAMLDFFLASDGFLAFTPVLACGIVGLVVVWRRGLRAEALTALGITVAFVVVLSAYYSPFGGFLFGPRYLITTIPLLALGLPAAFRRAPFATAALALASGVMMATITATHALAGHDHRAFHRLADRELTLSAASLVGITGWYAMLPFFAAVAASGLAAAFATKWPRLGARGLAAAAVVVAAWLILRELAPVETEGSAADYLLLGAIAVVAGAAALRLEQPVRSA